MKKKNFIIHFCLIISIGLFVNITFGQSINKKHIREKKLIAYNINQENVEPTGRILTLEKYDKKGNLTELNTYNKDGSLLSKKNDVYDSDNKILETIVTSPKANFSSKTKFSYEGDLLVNAVTTYSGQKAEIILRNIYEGTKIKEIILRSSDNKVYNRIVNTYNTEGKLIKAIAYNLAGEVIAETNQIYKESGVVTHKLGKNKKFEQRIEKKYNDKGMLVEEVYQNYNGKVIKSISNTYNKKGYLTEIINQIPMANIRTRITNTYNNEDQLINQMYYNKFDRLVKLVKIEYEYYK